MYTYTQNRILHHEDCQEGSLYPWKRSRTNMKVLKYTVGVVVDDRGCGHAELRIMKAFSF